MIVQSLLPPHHTHSDGVALKWKCFFPAVLPLPSLLACCKLETQTQSGPASLKNRLHAELQPGENIVRVSKQGTPPSLTAETLWAVHNPAAPKLRSARPLVGQPDSQYEAQMKAKLPGTDEARPSQISSWQILMFRLGRP